MNKAVRKWITLLPLCGPRCQQYTGGSLLLCFGLFAFFQYVHFAFDLRRWDVLLLSGLLAFLVGLRCSGYAPARFHSTVRRLSDRGALVFPAGVEEFLAAIERKADTWARLVAFLAAAALFGAFLVVLLSKFQPAQLALGVLEVCWAYIAGSVLGRMACYGQLGALVRKHAIGMQLDPTHVDGAGGLKPVGDYYFFQAMVAAIPALFLGVWWFLIPVWPRDYGPWREVYAGLLLVAIPLELLAFLVPLWSFHQLMGQKKAELLAEADQLCREMSETTTALLKPQTDETLLQERLARMRDRYWAIENMTTWPVHARIRRRFVVNNLVLCLPVVSDVVQKTFDWKKLVEIFPKLQF